MSNARARRWLGAGVMSLLLTTPAMVQADYLADAGMGTVTVLANAVYIPLKLTYAMLGGVTGGVAYVLTGANYQVAEQIWTPSLGGNYVLHPDHLRGQQTIYFSGPTMP